jgi:hypothetical protein
MMRIVPWATANMEYCPVIRLPIWEGALVTCRRTIHNDLKLTPN